MKQKLLIMCVLCIGARAGFAQEQGTVTATVTQLAGQHVYLDAGSEHGVEQGDTLALTLGQRLLVISHGRRQSVTTFASAPFPVTRGMQLTFVLLKSSTNDGALEPAAPPIAIADPGESVMAASADASSRKQQRRRGKQLEIDGRLLLNLSMLQSETSTRGLAAGVVVRRYATPSLSINATVKNLPSDMRLNIHMRSDYRYQSRNPIAPEQLVRAYRLNLEKSLPFGQIQAGRFYNRYAQRGGYWDGLSFMAGSKRSGAGASIGFMPDRANSGISTQFPRFAFFAHYETPRKAPLTYRVSAAYNEIQPASIFLNHRFVGVEQRVAYGGFVLAQDLQLDQDPVSRSWLVSNFQINARVKLIKQVQLRGRYAIRQPYRLYNIDQPFLNRRDQYGGGVALQLGVISMGANYTSRLLNQQYAGRTVSGYFNTQPLTRFALSVSGTANHWLSDFGSASFVNGGLARHFGKAYTRLDYGFYRSESPNVADPIDMHRLSMSATIPFNQSLYWSVRGSYSESRFLRSFSMFTSLQVRF